jgi:hypothetical protein
MIWAADFDESMAYNLEENCLEALLVQLPRDSGLEMREESTENDNGTVKGGGSQLNHGNVERSMPDNNGMKSISSRPFCGLTRNFWSKNDRVQICTVISSTRNGHNELPVFCVAAILIMNSQKIIRETHSFDDMIKAGALYFLFVMIDATVLFFVLFFFSPFYFLPVNPWVSTICFSLCDLDNRLIRLL